MFRNFIVALGLFFVVSCAEMGTFIRSGSSDDGGVITPFANEPTQADLMNQYHDVPFPKNTKLDMKKSQAQGSGENWFGNIFFSSDENAIATFEYFVEHMPDYGWFLIMESQGRENHLVYEKDLRVSIVNIVATRSGSEISFLAGPRSQ